MTLDSEGFQILDVQPPSVAIKAPPLIASMPKLFDGCLNKDEAAVRMINKLTEPFSIEAHGIDEAWRRTFNALALIIATQVGIAP
jgi:hypothetical protein